MTAIVHSDAPDVRAVLPRNRCQQLLHCQNLGRGFSVGVEDRSLYPICLDRLVFEAIKADIAIGVDELAEMDRSVFFRNEPDEMGPGRHGGWNARGGQSKVATVI